MIINKLLGLRRIAMSAIQKPEVIFVLGGPGAGKGTTCKDIVKKTGYVHLSAGDLLREEQNKPGSEFGELIKGHIVAGTIVPNMTDKAIVKAVLYLECSQEVCTRRCINRGLKGSGRSDDNAESLVKRHQTFIKDTMPIIKYYEERGLLYKFNSMKPPKVVMKEVYEKFKEIGWATD
ncbi:Similar to cmpk1: UMP-CMP kinase (Xenopus laevis) [Cotesia congregata]|uniref:Similar to cmpk1: UMP-CMP kinase (Xenopus laevis) n=1 Tax=Cotesia congregata TaxID=51543 RepID=A0A8J2H5V3_COTCN|nr:Similar to cmpk1: UMP-CMP kinase (Xenopus laevis) [Cotesia congregata]